MGRGGSRVWCGSQAQRHLISSIGRASVPLGTAATAVRPPLATLRETLGDFSEGEVVRLAQHRVAPLSQLEGRLSRAAALPLQLAQRDVVVLQVPLLHLVRADRIVPASIEIALNEAALVGVGRRADE